MTESEPVAGSTVELARPLAQNAELAFVRTISCRAELVDWEAAATPAQTEALGSEVEVAMARGPGRVDYRANYPLEILGENGKVGARFEAVFVAAFTVPDDLELSESTLRAFGETTVMIVLHPYFRETLSSMLVRLGCADMIAGLIRVDAGAPTLPPGDPPRAAE